MEKTSPYQAKHKIRILTSGSLFDGHDAAINIMRRIIQRSGGEVIHLGHNRPVHEIVNAAIQEDVQGIAITSYQGGHNEFFKYAYDLLREKGAGHIKIFGGGGGTILPSEIEELHAYGIDRIYSPDDGRAMGLQGMINDLLQQCDFAIGANLNGEVKKISPANHVALPAAFRRRKITPKKAGNGWRDWPKRPRKPGHRCWGLRVRGEPESPAWSTNWYSVT
jgi:methylmalonyl-CoA mutase